MYKRGKYLTISIYEYIIINKSTVILLRNIYIKATIKKKNTHKQYSIFVKTFPLVFVKFDQPIELSDFEVILNAS